VPRGFELVPVGLEPVPVEQETFEKTLEKRKTITDKAQKNFLM
jgi:hypothetical protein